MHALVNIAAPTAIAISARFSTTPVSPDPTRTSIKSVTALDATRRAARPDAIESLSRPTGQTPRSRAPSGRTQTCFTNGRPSIAVPPAGVCNDREARIAALEPRDRSPVVRTPIRRRTSYTCLMTVLCDTFNSLVGLVEIAHVPCMGVGGDGWQHHAVCVHGATPECLLFPIAFRCANAPSSATNRWTGERGHSMMTTLGVEAKTRGPT
jgi:hypothetical protein